MMFFALYLFAVTAAVLLGPIQFTHHPQGEKQ